MQPDQKWDSAKERTRVRIPALLTLAGINPGQREIFRVDKNKGFIKGNVEVGRLDALLVIRDEDFLEKYAEIIKQSDALEIHDAA
jgi:hypothetical protein